MVMLACPGMPSTSLRRLPLLVAEKSETERSTSLAAGGRALSVSGFGTPRHFVDEGVEDRASDGSLREVVVDHRHHDQRLASGGFHVTGEGARVLQRPGLEARLLRNPKGLYLERADWERVARIADRLLKIAPDTAEAWRDRGLAYRELGHAKGAREDLTRYLQVLPNADDEDAIRTILIEVSGTRSRLN